MVAWKRASEALVQLFGDALPDDPRVERRKMFGYPCAFVGGNMFAGLHQESLIVRLSEAGGASVMEEHGAKLFEPMPGRTMREYVALPRPILADRRKLATYMRQALDYAGSLPAKVKKARAGGVARPRVRSGRASAG